jgi:hypothetical protein
MAEREAALEAQLKAEAEAEAQRWLGAMQAKEEEGRSQRRGDEGTQGSEAGGGGGGEAGGGGGASWPQLLAVALVGAGVASVLMGASGGKLKWK